MFRNQQERRHCGLPLFGIVFCLRQLGDVERRVAKRDQRFPARQYDRIEKPLIPRHELTIVTVASNRRSVGEYKTKAQRSSYFSGNFLMKVAVPSVVLPGPNAVTLNW